MFSYFGKHLKLWGRRSARVPRLPHALPFDSDLCGRRPYRMLPRWMGTDGKRRLENRDRFRCRHKPPLDLDMDGVYTLFLVLDMGAVHKHFSLLP